MHSRRPETRFCSFHDSCSFHVQWQTDDGIINAVTPNSTVITTRGAQAQDLSVGVSRTGILVIQNGRPLADSFGIIGNLPGWGRATVTGVGSS